MGLPFFSSGFSFLYIDLQITKLKSYIKLIPMKKIILFTCLVFLTFGLYAQTVDLRRKIEVNGSAETEVTPDIIYVAISLREYMENKKKVNIDDLERQLQSAVLKSGIPKENFMINNISAYNYSWDRKRILIFWPASNIGLRFLI